MNKKIQISREIKITLLKALKKGYFETSDLENILTIIHSGLTDEELKELYKKIDVREPLNITFEI